MDIVFGGGLVILVCILYYLSSRHSTSDRIEESIEVEPEAALPTEEELIAEWKKTLNKMTKTEIDEFALKEHGIVLDRRRTKAVMIDTFISKKLSQ